MTDKIKETRKFQLGDRVTKTKGSNWTGRVVGFYSTSLTPIGYAVESETEKGSVQIYPEQALRDHYQARPTFDGDEAEALRWLTGVRSVHACVIRALLDAKDAEKAALREDWARQEELACGLLTQRDAALSRAEQAEQALAEERKAMSEAVRDAKEACGHLGLRRAFISERFDRFLPAKPAVDPLVEDEDPIDALVSLLAPVLTHGQGMAARERENRFRNALQAIKAGAANALLAQRSKQP